MPSDPRHVAPLMGRSIDGVRRDSLTVQMTRDLLARIVKGELRPGEQIPTERALMVEYGVSRTVVREAVSSLRAGGHIATQQGRGTFVLAPQGGVTYRLERSEQATVQDVLAFMEVRIALESEAAFLAAQRRTPDDLGRLRQALAQFEAATLAPDEAATFDIAFHVRIAEASQNGYFIELVGNFSPGLLPRLRLDLFKGDEHGKVDYARRLQFEHVQILDAIAEGDAEGARVAVRRHLSNSRDRLRRALEAMEAKADPLG